MKLALVQTNPVFGELRANVEHALSLMERVAADLYVLPELFNTGYSFASSEELSALAEPSAGQTSRAMSRFARGHSCYAVYGFAERAERIYNAAALVGPKGLIGVYRKVHLFDREVLLFAKGNRGFPVFRTPLGNIGVMICFDWIYPESARSLTLKGAQLIAHPSNLVLPYCPDAMVTRCLENRVFAATADRVGAEDRAGASLRFIGRSQLVSPRGEALVRLGDVEEGCAVAEISLSDADVKTINPHNDLLLQRRPNQYTS